MCSIGLVSCLGIKKTWYLPLNQEASNSLLQAALLFFIYLVITLAGNILLSRRDGKSGLCNSNQALPFCLWLLSSYLLTTLPPILPILALKKLPPVPFLLTSRKPTILQRFFFKSYGIFASRTNRSKTSSTSHMRLYLIEHLSWLYASPVMGFRHCEYTNHALGWVVDFTYDFKVQLYT